MALGPVGAALGIPPIDSGRGRKKRQSVTASTSGAMFFLGIGAGVAAMPGTTYAKPSDADSPSSSSSSGLASRPLPPRRSAQGPTAQG
jgi:hypothetical protein